MDCWASDLVTGCHYDTECGYEWEAVHTELLTISRAASSYVCSKNGLEGVVSNVRSVIY